jgi:hypothetical protein
MLVFFLHIGSRRIPQEWRLYTCNGGNIAPLNWLELVGPIPEDGGSGKSMNKNSPK